ncbi:Protein of unknown function [Roseomonas rosea]|uniref:DUF2934 domain-containing protein n=1 Tax=Muricoccus roseus TaxID=198092 RepID=A0A1M6GU45_9PROT|nr:DUF2934 domain-containing protein [Roseomonas rosea]SHJ13486.1 Protein of unknown function [Roseomonas rosea]
MPDANRIRERAYQLWESAGRPDGQHDAHWAQAEQEMAAGEEASPTMTAPDDGGASPGEAAAAAKAVEGPDGRQGQAASLGNSVTLR